MTTTPEITTTFWNAAYGSNAAENYQAYFVPVIGRPCAIDLVNEAGLRRGEQVLDVACGTGTVARMAAERVAPTGSVSALDVNDGMLAVARTLPSEIPIKWYETAAESVPLPDKSFDVVFCGIGLQFFADRSAALREMHRVLRPGGRVYTSTPVPNAFFEVFDRAIGRHVSDEAASFVRAVFSLGDPREMEGLLSAAGFASPESKPVPRVLQLPPAREFMRQYIACTPLMGVLSQFDGKQLEALEREIVDGWQPWTSGEGLRIEQFTLVSSARRVA